jgi:short-subunit dehydrogenase
MEIAGRHIVLTGAASGIGHAILEQLSRYRAYIVAADVDHQRLEDTLKKLADAKAVISPFTGDLSLQKSVDQLFDFALSAMGTIDLFIANAGFAYYEIIEKPDWEHVASIFRLNVFSPIYAAEVMKSINVGRKYKVLMVSSAMGRMSMPGYSIYAATKAAFHRFAEGYRFELDDPSTLTVAYPIATRTRFFDTASVPRAPVPWPSQSPEHVARVIIKGIERDRASIHPSRLYAAVLTLDRFLPFLRKFIQWLDRRRLEKWSSSQGKSENE